MHTLALLILTPAIIATIFGLYTKLRQRKIADLIILSLTAIAAIVNAVLVYQMVGNDLSVGEHITQMAACSMLLPLTYMYFVRQITKHKSDNTITVVLWVLALFTFVPEFIICNPFEPFVIPYEGLEPFGFYILSGHEKLFAMYTGDLAVILQCIVIIIRIAIFINMLRTHALHLNRKLYTFGGYSLFFVTVIILITLMNYNELRNPSGTIFYFGAYSFLFTSINIFVLRGYDIHIVETEQGETVEDVEEYVHHQYTIMASRLQSLLEEERLYADPQLKAERVVSLLRTNHTYFSEMMASVWGVSFSEYLGNIRLTHAEALLHDNTLTIGAIAAQCGFSDASYMGKKFKAKYGQTPTEWRKSRIVSQ